MSTFLDDVSRIIAGPVSRRKALGLVTGALGGAFLTSLSLRRPSWGLPQAAQNAQTTSSSNKCKPGQTACGNDCCSSSQQCCHGKCCPSGQTCCSDGSCCPSSQTCCDGKCCDPGQTCCNKKCCPGLCCGGNCCEKNQVCCNGKCLVIGVSKNGKCPQDSE
jgi:hypothetical protein